MKISELQNGQVMRLRLGRYAETGPCACAADGNPDAGCNACGGSGSVALIEPVWGPWQERKLYVQRDSKSKVCTVTIDGEAWAEYDPRNGDFSAEDQTFESEGYYMQVLGLEA